MTLSPTQVAQFEQDGYLLLRGALADADLDIKEVAQLGDEAAASPFPQQCRGEIGTHHPGLILGGGSAPEHQQTR